MKLDGEYMNKFRIVGSLRRLRSPERIWTHLDRRSLCSYTFILLLVYNIFVCVKSNIEDGLDLIIISL